MAIESSGFRDDLWLDAAGNPVTEQGRMTESGSPANGTLEVEITIRSRSRRGFN